MRVTIIRDDGTVGVDGVFRLVNLSALAPGVRAVQWDGSSGHVEYDASANTTLDNMNAYQQFVDLWNAAAPPPPTPPTPAQNKAAAFDRINTAYEQAMTTLNGDYPDSEILSWPTQDAEATALLADKNADTPWLKGAAKGRNISMDNLALRVKKKSDKYLPAYGELTGKRQRLRDAIDALGDAPTLAQLNAIQW
jgi:hypothetical protein